MTMVGRSSPPSPVSRPCRDMGVEGLPIGSNSHPHLGGQGSRLCQLQRGHQWTSGHGYFPVKLYLQKQAGQTLLGAKVPALLLHPETRPTLQGLSSVDGDPARRDSTGRAQESASSCVNRPSVKCNKEQLGRQPVQSTA